MGNLCIIPARGGSKRIPRKNIKNFLGKPIIAYSIEAAIRSELFDEIMVSTDDQEIADVAVQYGAKVPFFRSKENSDDFATTGDVIEEVLNVYKNRNRFFNMICCLYATAPMISIEKLKMGFLKLKEEGYSSVFPIVEFHYPVLRGLRVTQNGMVSMFWPEHISSRSQDLDKVYHDAGQWYWLKVDNFEREKKIFTQNSGGIILEPLEVQDIDTDLDWKQAEIKYELLQSFR